MRTVGVVTVARSDYGLYLPVLRRIEEDPELRLRLFVGGMHLAEEYGLSVGEIEKDGFPIAARVPAPLASDGPLDIARAMATTTAGFAEAYARERPDMLLVLGDRYEMHAAAVAALPFILAIAHIHGGESTVGAIDDTLRHSITKMSHLHFAATESYAQRIAQLGEESWRITVSGAPGLDAIRTLEALDVSELEAQIGLDIDHDTLLVTYHPATLEPEKVEQRAATLLRALDACGRKIIFTAPNADTHGATVRALLDEYVASSHRAVLVSNLGSRAYLSLMRVVGAMVGNSSSGIIEAASFELPVVNVGTRQKGRVRTRNVIDVDDDAAKIVTAIERATSPAFRASLAGLENPHGDGRAAERIVKRLAAVQLNERLYVKRFAECEPPDGGVARAAR